MDGQNWEELASLFEQAMEMTPTQREIFLRTLKSQDEALWAELVSLLESAGGAGTFFNDFSDLLPNLQTDSLSERLGHASVHTDSYQLIGKQIGKYRVIEVLGSGGMGVVYKAEDTELHRLVALKFLPPALSNDATAHKRFLAEARAASTLDHANICTIHEIGRTEDGLVFIGMAYYDGETLKQKIDRGPMPLEEAIMIALQIGHGLKAAHAHQIVHRDIKPANIMIASDGIARILDFGVAKVMDQNLTQSGSTMGTVYYMSPEQIQGARIGPASDVWSFGVVLYEMLTAEKPFPGLFSAAILYKIVHEEPELDTPAGRRIPGFVRSVILRCLQKDLAGRYSSISEALEDLQTRSVVTSSSDKPAEANRSIKTNRSIKQKWVWVMPVLLLVLALSFWKIANERWFLGPQEKRIAVLPLRAMPLDNQENLVLATGVTHVLTGMLTRFDTPETPLWVLPASRVQDFEIASTDMAASRLGVNYVVEGSLEHYRDVTFLTLNLIDPQRSEVINSIYSVYDNSDLSNALGGSLETLLFEELAVLMDFPIDEDLRTALRAELADDPEAYAFYLQGLGYLLRFDRPGHIDYAIQQFGQSLDIDASYAPAHAGLCEALWEKFNRETRDTTLVTRAITSCDRAAELAGNQTSVLVPLSSVYLRTGDTQRARRAIDRAIALEPDNAEAHRWLGRIYEQQGLQDSAYASYSRAISIKPGVWTYRDDLGIFLSFSGRHEEAAEQFEHVRRLTPDNYFAINALGVIERFLNHFNEAEALFLRAIELRPDAPEPRRNLGTLYFKHEDYEAAASEYAIAAATDDWYAQNFLGHAYYWAGDPARADSAWQKAAATIETILAVDDTHYDARLWLADTYISLGEVERGIEELSNFPDVQLDYPWFAYYAGRLYERIGNRTLALSTLERAFEGHFDVYIIDRDPWLADLRRDSTYLILRDRYIHEEDSSLDAHLAP